MTTISDEGDLLLRVSGIVPTDDFQPFVLRLAHHIHVRGWVTNDSRGALIRAIGIESQLVGLVHGILHDAPPSLRIRSVDVEAVTDGSVPAGEGFVSLPDDQGEFTTVTLGHEPPALSRVA
jgi:hydrogenase maturation factor HypF (carbamoyltransferase family)